MFLIILYFARRLLKQLYYHYRLREHLIFTTNRLVLSLVIFQVALNVLYIFWDLILNYSVYSLLPLFYFSLLYIPMFRLDVDKRYENASKEMMRCLKSKIIILFKKYFLILFSHFNRSNIFVS